MKKNYTIIFILFLTSFYYSQNVPKDSLYGNIRKIREKVLFLTKKENPQLLYYDDYGHSGFMGPESTKVRFFDTWFSSEICYYINNERYFNKDRKITHDIWYGKNDSIRESYQFVYDDTNRLIRKIDSSLGIETHYYSNYGDENIISENLKYHLFSHTYKKYRDGKLILSKNFDNNGTAYEHKYAYNLNGKLSYRIYKNPNTWKKIDKRSFSYGIQDSIGKIYKDIINFYDDRNRIIESCSYDLYEDEKHENPVITTRIQYIYLGNNLITKIQKYKEGPASYYNYRYDDIDRLKEKYCCSKNIDEAKLIYKYHYQRDGKIDRLEYTEEDFPTKKMKTYKVLFSYRYDINKNWIEIIKNVNGKDLYKWTREIDYY